jgi:hypothetical protein
MGKGRCKRIRVKTRRKQRVRGVSSVVTQMRAQLLRPCDTFRKSLGGSCKGTGAVFSKDGFERMKVMALEQPCAKQTLQLATSYSGSSGRFIFIWFS